MQGQRRTTGNKPARNYLAKGAKPKPQKPPKAQPLDKFVRYDHEVERANNLHEQIYVHIIGTTLPTYITSINFVFLFTTLFDKKTIIAVIEELISQWPVSSESGYFPAIKYTIAIAVMAASV